MSVIDYIDKILVWDTLSNDRTVEIIKEVAKIKDNKIDFKQVGFVDENEFSRMRQKMLEESNCEWILILDGDEIWWEDSIKKVREVIYEKGDKIDGIVVPMVVPVGDIFHIQEERAGQYNIHGRKGHISLKAFSKKIPGLHVEWPFGKEGFFDSDNRPIQEREKITFLDAPFLHGSHLKRSSSKRKYDKFKYELGKKAPQNFKYPQVLYKYPSFIPSPWIKISGMEKIVAGALTPLRKIKRRIV